MKIDFADLVLPILVSLVIAYAIVNTISNNNRDVQMAKMGYHQTTQNEKVIWIKGK